ncbi:hypothetical protein ACHAP6_008847, partial [Verticillium nonalfalfae]
IYNKLPQAVFSRFPNVSFVNHDWLDACSQQGSLVDVGPYIHDRLNEDESEEEDEDESEDESEDEDEDEKKDEDEDEGEDTDNPSCDSREKTS